MARWKTVKEANEVLGRTVNLSRIQWSILVLVLAVPVLAIVSNVFGLNYEAQANQSEISSNDELINNLIQQNEQMSQTIKAQSVVIAKQKKDINSLESNNQVLSSSLTATEAELEEKEEHKKKKNDDNWCWWCDND